MFTLYAHIFPNNKIYIGITSAPVKYRWYTNGEGYKSQHLMWRAIQKYGWNNIKHIILLENLSKDMACECEKYLIAKYDTTNREYGYNIYIGGDVGNHSIGLTEQQKEHLREINTGKHHSKETRLKMSQSHKGKVKTKEHLTNIGNALRGRKLNDAQRKKLSVAHKGYIETDTHKQHISVSMKQYINGLTEEEKQKRINNLKNHNVVAVELYENGKFIKAFTSCRECADYIGVSPSMVCMWLSGKRKSSKYVVTKTI